MNTGPNTYELIELSGEDLVNKIELTHYEFKQALLMHKRMAQRKER